MGVKPFSRIALALCIGSLAGPLNALSDVEVRIVGASEEAVEALQDALEGASATRRAIEDEISDVGDQLAAAQVEYRAMISVLYGKGFYGPTVSVKADGQEVADINPFALPSSIDKVVITVDPGPQFRFGDAVVAPREPTAAATGAPLVEGFRTGEVAGSGLIGSAANAAISEWRNVGHAKASIGQQDIVADHNVNQLDVNIEVAPGPSLRFGNVTYAGVSKVREKRIREILGLPEGEVFSPTELNDAANRLRRAGAFKTVVLEEAEQPNPDGTLDYTLTVIDDLPRRFGFGAEYSTLDGAAINGFWMHRNLFGGSERLRIEGEVSNIGGTQGGGTDYRASFRLNRPAAWGPDNDAFLFSDLEHNDEPDYVESSASIGIGLTRYFSDNLYGEVAGGVRYSYVEDAFGEREFNHFFLPSRLEWDMRDDPGDATRGFYIDARAVPAAGYQGSENFFWLDLDNRGYISFADKAVTLAGRVQLGSAMAPSLTDVPPDFLFFSGGGDTVRGQDYQSLGGSTFNGDTVGGRSFLGVSAEVRARFGDLGVVGFVDYGFVGDESWIDQDANEHSGVGIGVRYATPIGPIRVDLATPYTGPEEEFSRVELYIGVGQAF